MNKRTEIRLCRPRVLRLAEWLLAFGLALSVAGVLLFALLRYVLEPS